MRRTILTILGSALLASSMIQIAAAAEHHKAHKIYSSAAPVADQYRNSSAEYRGPAQVQPDRSRYQNGAASAPMGH
jgi:Ni/Co efflux regulator RcnB